MIQNAAAPIPINATPPTAAPIIIGISKAPPFDSLLSLVLASSEDVSTTVGTVELGIDVGVSVVLSIKEDVGVSVEEVGTGGVYRPYIQTSFKYPSHLERKIK
jgi:hypothetical protein